MTSKPSWTQTAPTLASLGGLNSWNLDGTRGDPFRVITSMPGVSQLSGLLPYVVVRGAAPGNTGYYLDGTRVPILFHVALGPSVIHPYFIDAVDWCEARGGLEHFWVRTDQLADGHYGVSKAVELVFRIGFRRLNHEAEDFREGDGRGVEAEVEEELADAGDDVRARDAGSLDALKVFFREREDELVHPWDAIGGGRQRGELLTQPVEEVAAGEDGHRGHALNARVAEAEKVGVDAHLMCEVAPVAVEGTDAVLRADRHEAVALLFDLEAGEEVDEALGDGHDAVARAAAAVRDGPGLVQVIMDRVDAEGAEVHPARDGIHVGAVHVDEAADAMDL